MIPAERLVWFASHWRIEQGVLIYECPPGEAEWSHYIRDRGQMLLDEVTCWPMQRHRYVQTTGYKSETQLHDLLLKGEQNRMAVILDMRADRAEAFAERWRKEAVQLTTQGYYIYKGVRYEQTRPTRQSVAGRRKGTRTCSGDC